MDGCLFVSYYFSFKYTNRTFFFSFQFKVLNPFLTLAYEIGMAAKMKKVREKLENISKQRHEFSFIRQATARMHSKLLMNVKQSQRW